MIQAESARASRAAIVCNPTPRAAAQAREVLSQKKSRVLERGGQVRHSSKRRAYVTTGNAPRAPGVSVRSDDAQSQGLATHLVAIKSRGMDSANVAPSWLLGAHAPPLAGDRLLELALRCNAVSASVVGREKTKSSNPQTTRISCRHVGAAAAAQVVAVEHSAAFLRHQIRRSGLTVAPAGATCAVPLGALWAVPRSTTTNALFTLVSHDEFFLNILPLRVGSDSLAKAIIRLAESELKLRKITAEVCNRSEELDNLCHAVCGRRHADRIWAIIVLVVFLTGHPRGRRLLAEEGIVDFDVQLCLALERYGAEEMRRRARQRQRGARGQCEPLRLEDECAPVEHLARGTTHKRARPSASSTDAHDLLIFWDSALQSVESSVLGSLVAESAADAQDAGLHTLQRQATGRSSICDNEVIAAVTATAAEHSAAKIAPMFGRRQGILLGLAGAANPAEAQADPRVACVLRNQKDGRNAILHACLHVPMHVAPAPATGVAIAWSTARQACTPRDDRDLLPGVQERRAILVAMRNAHGQKSDKGIFLKRKARLEQWIAENAARPVPECHTGSARSFISLVCDQQRPVGAQESVSTLVQRAAQWAASETAESSRSSVTLPAMLKPAQAAALTAGVLEPFCTPATPLVLALQASELLRRWRVDRTRKGSACLKSLLTADDADAPRELPSIASSEPLPALFITQFEIEELRKKQVGVGLHVCGGRATRVTDLVTTLISQKNGSPWRRARSARGGLLATASQCSYIAEVASALRPGYSSSSIASSKRIGVADLNMNLFLTPWQAYVAEQQNVACSFRGSAYCGAYGPRLDHGLAAAGIEARNYGSDARHHGSFAASQDVIDELAVSCARACIVDDGRDGVALPAAFCGVPHGLVTNVHTALDDHAAFLSNARAVRALPTDADDAEATNGEDARGVEGIFVLPLSPFAQHLPPDVAVTADASMRGAFRDPCASSFATGRAHLPDATSELHAIFTEPLFRRASEITSADNCFATALDAGQGALLLVSTIALLARTLERLAGRRNTPPQRALDALHSRMRALCCGEPLPTAEALLAADALVLCHALFPKETEVGKLALDDAVAALPRRIARAADAARPRRGHAQLGAIHATALLAASEWLLRDSEALSAWPAVRALGALLLKLDGTHDISAHRASLRDAVNALARATWLRASNDGHAPPTSGPLVGLPNPETVTRLHLEPSFVETSHDNHRASPLALAPHSLRQLLCLLMAAAPRVNVAQNVGALCLRASSDASILAVDGSERTDKAVSPLQRDGDAAAFGSREAKLAASAAQRRAFDANLRLLSSVFFGVRPPTPDAQRFAGEAGLAAGMARLADDAQRACTTPAFVDSAARRLEDACASPGIARAAHEAL